MTTTTDSITLRLAQRVDDDALRRLAALDEASPLTGDVLVAEVDGELRAALSLADGASIADPFHRTLELVELLRARALTLTAGRRQSRRRLVRGLAPRFA